MPVRRSVHSTSGATKAHEDDDGRDDEAVVLAVGGISCSLTEAPRSRRRARRRPTKTMAGHVGDDDRQDRQDLARRRAPQPEGPLERVAHEAADGAAAARRAGRRSAGSPVEDPGVAPIGRLLASPASSAGTSSRLDRADSPPGSTSSSGARSGHRERAQGCLAASATASRTASNGSSPVTSSRVARASPPSAPAAAEQGRRWPSTVGRRARRSQAADPGAGSSSSAPAAATTRRRRG